MLETILFALLIAKIKDYKLKPIFKSFAFYPSIAFTLFYVIWNISIFFGDYSLIKYSSILEKIYLLTFLTLVFKYNLYKSAFLGSFCIFIGTSLNKLAIAANGGKMPVFPTLSYITGYVKADSFTKVNDIHVLGSGSTKLKFLTDYIDLGYSILSVGDIFIRLFVFIIIFSSIKHINEKNIKLYSFN
ncbi:DUF5317 domain-containing protein [Clostridium sp. SYSU_GA19001]|uniref:DUF5317 family protein n=1 Tax=Clostridium caldaquaticum TaxID=2940653 RepID=UPI0020774CEA|nr:DUF5317 family protein [Clostridium caldaquaticum]MCM8710255.1 DUF5317 domain-containing protein [Clostridium caldaquaticum]